MSTTVVNRSFPSWPAYSTASSAESAANEERDLPRLLYVGDVPISSTIGGAALLYRLLESYPPERLLVVEGNLWSRRPEWGHRDPQKRLRNVTYKNLNVGVHRILCSRLGRLYAAYLQAT